MAVAKTTLTIDPALTDVSERFVRYRGTLAIDASPATYVTGGLTINSLISAVKATGTITCVPKASLVDGETFTISDGVNTPTVFEFDVAGDGVTPGNVAVDVSGATTALDVATIVKTAINGVVGTLLVTAVDNLTGIVYLTADDYGTVANVTITETVTDSGFVVTGMSGATTGSWSGPSVEGNELIEARLWTVGAAAGFVYRSDGNTVRIFGQEPTVITAGVLALSQFPDATAIPSAISGATIYVELTYKKLT